VPTTRRLVSLSAGTVLDATPTEAAKAAAAAGFDGMGLRWDPDRTPLSALPALRRTIETHGLTLLDLEVVRLRPGVPVSAHRALVDVAGELGARFLLVVSDHPNASRTRNELSVLAGWAESAGVRVAVEFMRFTAVPTLAAANALVRAVDSPHVCVLVDALHLQRGGDQPSSLTPADLASVGYVQLCDAPRAFPGGPNDLGALAHEARHSRLLPGEGQLPLTDLLGVLAADLPCCVEVQSDHWAGVDVGRRAQLAMDSVWQVLASVPGQRQPTAPRRDKE